MIQVTTMADLIKELELATLAHNEAVETEKKAAAITSSARNRLNQSQKAVDQMIENMRKAAPWNTDWYSKTHPGHVVG